MTAQAGPVEPAAAGAVLGRAFLEDPVWSWVLRGADRQRRLAAVFGSLAGSVTRTPGGRVLGTADRTVAALWFPPGHWRSSATGTLRQLPASAPALRPGGVLRALRLQAAVERVHAREQEPHWYLEALGAVPEARGTGAGPRVVQPVLDACDEAGLAAYLESSNPRNWTFYERLGFVRGAPVPLPAGCPVVVPMRRAPR